MDSSAILDTTRRWIAEIVIGLNLCPFARRVFEGDRIRYIVTAAASENELLTDFEKELVLLRSSSRDTLETTLLIAPNAFPNFLDFNDTVAILEEYLDRSGYRGEFQLATFHPNYQFADTLPEDVDNYTNRSPFPMLHLLREVSIDEVSQNPQFLEGIPARNIALLRALGEKAIREKLA